MNEKVFLNEKPFGSKKTKTSFPDALYPKIPPARFARRIASFSYGFGALLRTDILLPVFSGFWVVSGGKPGEKPDYSPVRMGALENSPVKNRRFPGIFPGFCTRQFHDFIHISGGVNPAKTMGISGFSSWFLTWYLRFFLLVFRRRQLPSGFPPGNPPATPAKNHGN